MVEYSKEDQLDLIFHALSDRTRRNLLNRITSRPQRITDLAANYEVSLNSISKHIKVLEKAILVIRNVEGRVHYCQMNPKELKKAQTWIKKYEKFWNDRLDSLEEFVINKK